ncbi:hypothetical protein NY607_18280 [Lysinibacillus sp. A4]|nr:MULTISPECIES: hypothetical protein [unclassified Lysinibacillus]MCS5503056.1 hypothetical protein [Lysinibacillus sp. A4]WGT39965.1 hypothetical protein QH639_04070 [Lysinibacillus sp. 1 U-2021]
MEGVCITVPKIHSEKAFDLSAEEYNATYTLLLLTWNKDLLNAAINDDF